MCKIAPGFFKKFIACGTYERHACSPGTTNPNPPNKMKIKKECESATPNTWISVECMM